ncbi:MAG: AMP-binding protein [Pseudomonadota bacterium]
MRPIDYIDRGALYAKDRPFVAGEDGAYTFAEMQSLSGSIAEAMYAQGFKVGDSAAVFSPNNALAVVCVMSVLRAGGAWVPVNVRNAPSTNAAFMGYVDTHWIFFHSSVLDAVETIVADIPSLKGVVCIDSANTPYPSLEAFRAKGAGTALPDWSDPFGAPDVVFSRWPTGGTTGPSKGVEISNRSISTMIELGLKHYVGDRTDDIVHLAVAPITHAAGVIITIFAAVGGGTIVLPGFDAPTVLKTIETARVTHIFLPPTAFYGLLDEAARNTYDTSSLRQIIIAAAPVAPEKLREGVKRFGPVIAQCFGQAESPMMVSWMRPEILAAAAQGEHPERVASCGQITSATQVAILDETGTALPPGERGEICVRGPLVTPGYYKLPEATAEIRRHGWHHTGDVGYLDEHGFLYIVDRLKDMIITGGFNVFSAEVEAPILALPEVLECAVVGVPDPKWGEAVKAIVVLREGQSLDEAGLIEQVKPKLGSVKTPKSVEFWPALPKTNVGKTDKKEIKKKFQA